MRSKQWKATLRRAAAAGCAAALLFGCSSEQETAGGDNTQQGDCASSEAKSAFDKTWDDAFKAAGVEAPDPQPDIEVCDVDTGKWKKDKPAGGYKIGFAAQGPTNSWPVTEEAAFKEHAKKLGVQELYAAADGDATKQVTNLQQLIAQKPDALVVVPMGAGIVGQLQAAQKQNIPVVLCSGVLPNSGAVSTVTRSYNLLGAVYAEWMAKKIGEKGEVAMISGIAGVPTAELIKAAAEKAFAKYPNIKVVAKQNGDWSPTKAKTVTASLMAKYPNLSGIWTDSGTHMLAVAEVYKAAGKKIPPTTGDSSNAFLKQVQNVDVPFLSGAFPPEMSVQCLDTAMKVLAGEKVPSFVNVDAVVYSDADKAKYVRKECTDNLWVPSKLEDDVLKRLKLC